MDNTSYITISNGWICQIKNNSVDPVFGDLIVSGGKIERIIEKKFSRYIQNKSEAPVDAFDAAGRIITIPQINFHDHFYSRLAKGLPIEGEMDSFEKILKNLWWKLDLKLDLNQVAASAQMGVLESIRNGVTYIFDHHASPAATKDSLEVIGNVLQRYGLRGVLCFETSDRNGNEAAQQGLAENQTFIKKHSEHIKGMLGLHASFTISDDTLRKAAAILDQTDSGIHIHLCEDIYDWQASVDLYGATPVQRLEKFGLMNPRSILSHGIHLQDKDYRIISKAGCAIAYNPDSNLNNAVGLPEYKRAPTSIPILVGTDGMHANVARSLKQLFLLYRHQHNSFDDSFNWIQKIYFDQLNFIGLYFPDFPSLNIGDRADFIIWDYVPPTPLYKENYWGHFIYGIVERTVHSVIQNGQFLMKDFRLTMDDEKSVLTEIFKQGERLYKNF